MLPAHWLEAADVTHVQFRNTAELAIIRHKLEHLDDMIFGILLKVSILVAGNVHLRANAVDICLTARLPPFNRLLNLPLSSQVDVSL